ncbi:MAG: cupredoxin domain-containing protein [Acidimicrobiia bacterium]|nr:cupredoxin domain-containing protein [Acidimicrobiia bacterium]
MPSLRNLCASTALLLAGALALGACGDDDADTASTPDASAPEAVTPATDATDAAAPMDAGAAEPTTVECVAGEGGDTVVEIADFLFVPTPAEVAAGGSVTFANTDDFPHSVWSEEREGGERAWETVGPDAAARAPENLATDDSSTCSFPAAGTYEFICGIHNTMRGTVTVG